MIYLKRLLNLIWLVIKVALVFTLFYPTLFIDVIIGPLIYYITTGRNYYSDFDPLLALCVYLFLEDDSNKDINDTVLRLFIKKK